jgi:hypothetical protein
MREYGRVAIGTRKALLKADLAVAAAEEHRHRHGWLAVVVSDQHGLARIACAGELGKLLDDLGSASQRDQQQNGHHPSSGHVIASRELEALIVRVTQTQYTSFMKSAVIPQIRVEPELRAELESVLKQGETLTDFVEATVRNAIAFRRVQTAFHARAQAASEEYHRTGMSVPVEAVLDKLQSKLDAKRKLLGR